MIKNMKSKIVIGLITFILLAFFSCSMAQVPSSGLEVEAVKEVEESASPGTIEEDEYFENGINQKYLKERGITEEELLEEILCRFQNEDFVSKDNSRGISKIINFFDVGDILRNPLDYFACRINTKDINKSYIDVGLNKTKLNEAVNKVGVVKLTNSKYHKHQAYDFYIHSMSKGKLIIKAKIRIREYAPLYIGKKIKIKLFHTKVADFRGNVEIEAKYFYNPVKGQVEFKSWRTTRIKLKNTFLNGVKNFFEQICRKKIKAEDSLSEKIPLNFLDKDYISFNKFYTADNTIYIRFTITPKSASKIIKFAKKYGFYYYLDGRLTVPPPFFDGDIITLKTLGYLTKDNQELKFSSTPTRWKLKLNPDGSYYIGNIGLGRQYGPSGSYKVSLDSTPTKWFITEKADGKYTIRTEDGAYMGFAANMPPAYYNMHHLRIWVGCQDKGIIPFFVGSWQIKKQ